MLPLTLRRVHKDDCRLLWEWANDPTVRSESFSADPIPWETHVEWFQSKLEDASCMFYIAVDREGSPIGQARYDIKDNEAVISISIAKDFRGRAYGRELIRMSSEQVFNNVNVDVIHAYIKVGNEASMRAFVHAGYIGAGTTDIYGQPAFHLTIKRVAQ